MLDIIQTPCGICIHSRHLTYNLMPNEINNICKCWFQLRLSIQTETLNTVHESRSWTTNHFKQNDMYFVEIACWNCRFEAINLCKALNFCCFRAYYILNICARKMEPNPKATSRNRIKFEYECVGNEHNKTHTHSPIITHSKSIFVSLLLPMNQMKGAHNIVWYDE